MQLWFNDAKWVPSLEVEICFLIQDDFYFGPDTVAAVLERKDIEALPDLKIPRKIESMVRTQEVLGHEEELVAYYQAVIDAAKSHQKKFRDVSQYFWLRLWLWNTEYEVHISFPWYDTYSEIERFFQCVKCGEQGQIFFDSDQCWELEIYARSGEFFARQRDPDNEDSNAIMVRFASQPLLNQIQEVCVRTASIIERLSTAIGRDVWTKPDEWPNFDSPKDVSVPTKRPWWKLR